MEASSTFAKGVGLGEVRRLHIIYFLSHMGRIEHPHLIRVHHLNRNGIHLRDVKRWLTHLRGKDMPEAFAWSYKRRYKNGYVWQDLLNDDLITPISDNEYVLKGSEIFPTTPFDGNAYGEKIVSMLRKDIEDKQKEDPAPKEAGKRYPDPIANNSGEASTEIYQESAGLASERSSPQDSLKQEEIPSKENCHDEEPMEKLENLSSSSFYLNLLGKKKMMMMKKKKKSNKNDNNNSSIEKMGTPSSSFSSSSSSSSSQSPFAKSRSYSSGTSKMLRNLITCGTVGTKDAVFVRLNKSSSTSNKPIKKPDNEAEICKRETLGASTGVFGTPWYQNQQHSARKGLDGVKGSNNQQQFQFGGPKVISAVYKPVGAPTCSQCGKSFKPEKFHAHMKSCRGMKAFANIVVTSVSRASSKKSGNSLQDESAHSYFLTN